MKKTKGKDSSFRVILTILIGFVIGVLIVSIYVSRFQMEKYARYMVAQNAQVITNEVNAYVSSSVSSIQLTSRLVTETMNSPDFEDANAVLNRMLEQTPFVFIEYVDKNGINMTEQGEAFDASDREYYKQGILGKTGNWINYSPKYAKEYLLNFYTPLYYENQVVGVLTGVLGADTDILPLMITDFLGEENLGILCDENGKIISATRLSDGETDVEDVLVKLRLDIAARQEFLERLKMGESGAYKYGGEQGNAIACVSLVEATGWRLIQIVPAMSVRLAMRKLTYGVYVATGIICLVLLFILFYLHIYFGKKHEDLLKETDRVVQNYEQILTTTASDTYKGIRRVDLGTGQSEYIYFEKHRVMQRRIGDWMTWLETQRKFIHQDDFEQVREFSSIDNLKKMEDGETYSISYRSEGKAPNGYYRTYTTTISIVSEDGKKAALLTTIDNTPAVITQLEQKQLLASAASIFISMHVLDLKKDTIQELSSAPHISQMLKGRREHAFASLHEIMSKLTDEQYLEEMLEFIDFGTLDERMKDVNTITMEFLGTVSGWCRARFIAVDYDEAGKLSRVLWAVEDIDAEKKKTNQLLYLSETDLMTGIRNRGSGERKIREYLEAGRQGTFFLLDVDKFKSINDTYGHGVGDKALIALADCIKKSFRESDIVLRLGGDEFAIFAVDMTDRGQAKTLVKRFFDSVEEISVPRMSDQKLFVSMGAAVKVNDDGLDFEALYRNADSCAYQSKKTEGNVCTFWES